MCRAQPLLSVGTSLQYFGTGQQSIRSSTVSCQTVLHKHGRESDRHSLCDKQESGCKYQSKL